MRRRLPVTAALAAALWGCSSEPTPIDSFTIKFQLDTEGEAATCRPGVGLPPPLTCESYELFCDARVSVRLLSIPENEDDPPMLLDEPGCLQLPWREGIDDICALGDPDLLSFPVFDNIQPVRGYVEVTIWPDSEAVQNCPMIGYDVVGRPLPDQGDRTPAFGRRVVFDFGGQDPVAEVPLACNAPQSLTDLSCEPPEVYDFEVYGYDIANQLIPIDENTANELIVRVGQPTLDADVDEYRIVESETVPLVVTGGASPFWTAEEFEIDPEWDFTIDEGKDICAIVNKFPSPPATTCTTITANEAAHVEPVSVDGYLIDFDSVWDPIQTAIGLNVFPADGLILGRVVDTDTRDPIPGVVVTADTPLPPVVQYINATLDDYRDGGGQPLTATSASGYFVAQGAAFPTTWDATKAGSTYRVVGTPRGGLLGNRRLTIVVIPMFEDFK